MNTAIFNNFQKGNKMSSTTFEIEKLYIEFFNRPADPGGLQFYSDAVNNKGLTITDIAHAMEQSAEYKQNFTSTPTWGLDAAVDRAFMNMFDHHASTAELNYWGQKFGNALFFNGHSSDVIMQIADSATGADLQHFMQKVTNALPAQLVGVHTADTAEILIA
ncbi:DUF4214 domain-containing protein [Massilia sp. YIM B04103]|uniref:DUF4214 domain-containing protein n=1 Tax=Massilia sp. YIM B04103 TaxID=2963106 RepID=UPI0035A63C68